MNFIREDLNRIRKKKTKFKGKLSIFDCLSRDYNPVTLDSSKELIRLNKHRLNRQERRERILWQRYEEYDLLCRMDSPSKLNKKRKRKLEKILFVTKKKYHVQSKRKRISKYSEYIKSDLWTRRKNLLFQKHGKRCMKCDSIKYISVHHLRYNNREFGKEKDIDLIALCWSCHKLFHKIFGVKKDSHKDYEKFRHMSLST